MWISPNESSFYVVILKLCVCVHVSECEFVHVGAGTRGVREKVSDSW